MKADPNQPEPPETDRWIDVTWWVFTAIAVLVAVDVLPTWLQGLLLGLLWACVILFYSLFVPTIASIPWMVRQQSGPWAEPATQPGWTSWSSRARLAIIVLALTLGGYLSLAGSFVFLPVVVGMLRLYGQVLSGGRSYSDLRRFDKGLYWLTVAISDFVRAITRLVTAVVMCPWQLWKHVRYRRSDRKFLQMFRQEFGNRDVLVYLLFSEPHQLSHFLGDGGVLNPFLDHVIARDWRTEITPRRCAQGWTKFYQTVEGELLRRYEISNLREHLPFVLVVDREGGFSAHHLGPAYRRRTSDKGVSLSVYETDLSGQIEAALERASPSRSDSKIPVDQS